MAVRFGKQPSLLLLKGGLIVLDNDSILLSSKNKGLTRYLSFIFLSFFLLYSTQS